MDRAHAIALLKKSKPLLAAHYAVTDLALFGSTARDTATDQSDVDILIRFKGPATSKRYFGAQFYLEDLFECRIDLVTDNALRHELRPFIEKDAIYV